MTKQTASARADRPGPASKSTDMLEVTDRRTGRTYELPIEHGTIRAIDLRQIKVSSDDFGLMTYDPGFTNTASCRSTVTLIDGSPSRAAISRPPTW